MDKREYYERCFDKYFKLNLKPFLQTIGSAVWWFDIVKFKRIIYKQCGYVEGNSDFCTSDKFNKTSLEYLLLTHYGRNAATFMDLLLSEEIPF